MIYALIAVFLTSLISLIGILTFSFKESFLKKLVFVLVSLSVGALFGDAFIHILPEVFESGLPTGQISAMVLSGILLFFALEKFLHWRHSHGIDEETVETGHSHQSSSVPPLGYMVIVADGIHNLIDGIIIAAGFGISFEVGLATAIAVALHEIPQEIADFGVLIHAGFSKAKAIFYNFCSALASFVGAGLVLIFGLNSDRFIYLALALAAGGFIYIAGSDLVPELQKNKNFKASMVQVASMIAGVIIMFLLVALE